MSDPHKKNPVVAAALSVIPGLGHLYLGRNRKAIALVCIDVGLAVSLLYFRSLFAVVLASGVYVMTMVPAALEAYLVAKSGHSSPILDSKPYVILMLLTTGINALPLLWQNANFSRRAKIAWTIAVPVLAVLFFGGAAWLGAHYVAK